MEIFQQRWRCTKNNNTSGIQYSAAAAVREANILIIHDDKNKRPFFSPAKHEGMGRRKCTMMISHYIVNKNYAFMPYDLRPMNNDL